MPARRPACYVRRREVDGLFAELDRAQERFEASTTPAARSVQALAVAAVALALADLYLDHVEPVRPRRRRRG
jgi:hypothetical protein